MRLSEWKKATCFTCGGNVGSLIRKGNSDYIVAYDDNVLVENDCCSIHAEMLVGALTAKASLDYYKRELKDMGDEANLIKALRQRYNGIERERVDKWGFY